MSATVLTAFLARCRVLYRPCSPMSDAELLRRFAQQRDAAAFEQLLERHGPLVWGVCRRLLPHESDCEDAFQATFLALARQAGRLYGRQPLAAWLHTIAVRAVRKAGARARRQMKNGTSPPMFGSGDRRAKGGGFCLTAAPASIMFDRWHMRILSFAQFGACRWMNKNHLKVLRTSP